MAKIAFPGHVPQPQRKVVIEITLGDEASMPMDIRELVAEAMWQHGGQTLAGMRTTFDLLPRAQHGDIITESGRKVGEWRITS